MATKRKGGFPRERLLESLRRMAHERRETARMYEDKAGVARLLADRRDTSIQKAVASVYRKQIKPYELQAEQANTDLAALQWALIELQKGE